MYKQNTFKLWRLLYSVSLSDKINGDSGSPPGEGIHNHIYISYTPSIYSYLGYLR